MPPAGLDSFKKRTLKTASVAHQRDGSVVAFVAVLFALRPALTVRPLDVLDARPHRRRRGMAIAFGCGFAAFVAVEVWGASLMRAFVPSPEWPDAIVSLLPGGAKAD